MWLKDQKILNENSDLDAGDEVLAVDAGHVGDRLRHQLALT